MQSKKILKHHIGGRGWVAPVGFFFMMLGIGWLEMYGNDIFGWLMVIGAALLFWGLFGELTGVIAAGGTVKWLAQKGKLDDAAAELQGMQTQLLCKNKVTLTPNFLFGKRMGVACAYEDILWVYKRRFTQRFLFIPIFVQDSLVIETGKRSMTISLGKKDKENELTKIIQTIYSKNQKVLVGHTEENAKAYKLLRKQMKQK